MYQYENLLIITKTYPLPSANYREHTCVVGVNEQGELRRLYPIPFRLLDGQKQFKKWQWIKAKIEKASSDRRPESYRIDVDSIELFGRINSRDGWDERLEWIQPHLFNSFSELENDRNETGRSLGFVKPLSIELEITPSSKSDWTPQELENLTKDGLFDTDKVTNRPLLRKIPFDFHYKYTCRVLDQIEQNRHMITDWEVGSLFWNCFDKTKSDWEKLLRQKLETEFSLEKELFFLMGTMHRFQMQWLIVGLIYPPRKAARQRGLWRWVLDEQPINPNPSD